jgi:multiple sugar transport system substrate-binding protein
MQLKKFMLTLIFLMLIAGCILTPTFTASKQLTLSVLYQSSGGEHKICIKKILKQYDKLHPKIKLAIQVVPLGKWSQVMRLRALANDYPDLTLCPVQRVGEWAGVGKLAAGNQYIPANVLNKFHKTRLASVTYHNGRIYGLPFTNATRAVAYNVDYFAKAGITPPQKPEDAWTWEELVVAAQKAQAASGAKYALQFDKSSFEGWMPFIYQTGGQLMNADCTRPTLNTPQVRKALEWTTKLHQDGIAAPGVLEGLENPVRLFASGLTTMWLAMGNWMMNSLNAQTKYEYSYTFMPKGTQAATVTGGYDWIVCKGAHPKEAWELLLYLVSPGPMTQYNEIANTIPPRSDVHVTWRIHPELAQFFAAQARECPTALMVQQIHPAYSACRYKLMQELSMCTSGQQSVKATLTAMDRIMEAALKQYHY